MAKGSNTLSVTLCHHSLGPRESWNRCSAPFGLNLSARPPFTYTPPRGRDARLAANAVKLPRRAGQNFSQPRLAAFAFLWMVVVNVCGRSAVVGRPAHELCRRVACRQGANKQARHKVELVGEAMLLSWHGVRKSPQGRGAIGGGPHVGNDARSGFPNIMPPPRAAQCIALSSALSRPDAQPNETLSSETISQILKRGAQGHGNYAPEGAPLKTVRSQLVAPTDEIHYMHKLALHTLQTPWSGHYQLA